MTTPYLVLDEYTNTLTLKNLTEDEYEAVCEEDATNVISFDNPQELAQLAETLANSARDWASSLNVTR